MPAPIPAPPRKKSKHKVSPEELAALQNRVADLTMRLEATERDKALVEHRLSALDATTTVLAGEQTNVGELSSKVDELEQRVATAAESHALGGAHRVGDGSDESSDNDQDWNGEGRQAHGPTTAPDPELIAKLDDLSQRLEAISALAPQVEQLDQRFNEFSTRIDEMPAPSFTQPLLPQSDPVTAERLDWLQDRVVAIDALNAQLTQINARVTAQNEVGAQLSRVADRVTELQQRTEHTSAELRAQLAQISAQATDHPSVDALTEQVAKLPDHSATIDELRARLDQLANTPAAPDHTADIDQLRQQLSSIPDYRTSIDQLRERLDQFPAAPAQAADIEQLRDQLDRLANLPGTPDQSTAIDELNQRIANIPDQTATIDELRTRLDQLPTAPDHTPEINQLRERLDQLPAAPDHTADIDQLRERLDQIANSPTAPDHTATIDELRERLANIPDHTATIEELCGQVAGLQERLTTTPDNSQIAQLAERVSATDHTARQNTELVAALDQRLSNISTELANQLSELGRDIDALAELPTDTSGLTDEQVEAIRNSQVKLANEQARYEIAFRQDLAVLAEQVRKASGRG